MKYSLALLAAAALVQASPFPMPQAVTAAVSPTASAPSGCTPSYSGSFGIVNINITALSTTSGTSSTATPVSQISDGQVQGSSSSNTVSSYASSYASYSSYASSYSSYSSYASSYPVSGTVATVSGTVAGTVATVSGTVAGTVATVSGTVAGTVATVSGTVAGSVYSSYASSYPVSGTVATVSGTVAKASNTVAGTVTTVSGTMAGAVSQISDGQVQGGMTVAMISMISDGQIQGGYHTAVISAVQTVSPTVTYTSAVSQISDGQVQAGTASSYSATATVSSAVSQISDGQVQATSAAGASQIVDGQVQVVGTSTSSSSSVSSTSIAFCKEDDTLALTLANGILKDSKGRTGYIASNYQLQFDNPPQAGAIYTAGFTVCANGSLALGSSSVWYECLSGSFYNLYDRNWAAQCNPVIIQTGVLVDCS